MVSRVGPATGLAEHRELRAAAAPGVRGVAGDARRLAGRPHLVGGMGRRRRSVRASRSAVSSASTRRRVRRRAGVPGARPGGGGARRPPFPGARRAEFTSNLFPWLVAGDVRTAPAADLADHIDSHRGRGRVQPRAVGRRRGGRLRRDRGGGPRARRARGRRRDAGVRVAAVRRVARRRGGRRRVQVADVAARQRVRLPRARPCANGFEPVRRRLVRRRGRARVVLRRRRCGWPDRPAASTSRRRGRSTSARHRRWRSSRRSASRTSTRTTCGWRTGSGPGWGCHRATARSSVVDVPGAEERLARAGVRAAVRAGRVRASFHIYTTDADVDAGARRPHRWLTRNAVTKPALVSTPVSRPSAWNASGIIVSASMVRMAPAAKACTTATAAGDASPSST